MGNVSEGYQPPAEHISRSRQTVRRHHGDRRCALDSDYLVGPVAKRHMPGSAGSRKLCGRNALGALDSDQLDRRKAQMAMAGVSCCLRIALVGHESRSWSQSLVRIPGILSTIVPSGLLIKNLSMRIKGHR